MNIILSLRQRLPNDTFSPIDMYIVSCTVYRCNKYIYYIQHLFRRLIYEQVSHNEDLLFYLQKIVQPRALRQFDNLHLNYLPFCLVFMSYSKSAVCTPCGTVVMMNVPY